ncbi:MAG: DUF3467 domain-containing protein [Candidatus Acidiferrum sp.]|jgi:hypothetical protein
MTEKSPPSSSGEHAEARYANYFTAGHNAFEVMLEFGQFYEGDTQPGMHTRIITTPAYAKTFLEVLQDLLNRHEKQFGSIVRGDAHE